MKPLVEMIRHYRDYRNLFGRLLDLSLFLLIIIQPFGDIGVIPALGIAILIGTSQFLPFLTLPRKGAGIQTNLDD